MGMSTDHGRLVPTRAVMYRGGTSRCLVVHTPDLPAQDPERLRQWLVAVYGSPDVREIDGVGGADILTSKFAHAARSARDDADLDYTFIQVGIAEPTVSLQILCGNISSCIAPWAIEEGLVPAVEPVTTVRIFNTNINKVFTAEVEVVDGRPRVDGDAHIDGVPGTAAPIHLDYTETWGARTGRLLPTGHVVDTMSVPGLGEIEYSVVDIAGTQLFLRAADFGLTAAESPAEIEAMHETLRKIRAARAVVTHRLGFSTSVETADVESPGSPFALLVGPAVERVSFTGARIGVEENDLVAFMVAGGAIHKAYPGTAAIPTAVAACVDGSLVNRLSRARRGDLVRIGHPSGVFPVTARLDQDGTDITVTRASYMRTARRIMEGNVFVSTTRVPWLDRTLSHPVAVAPIADADSVVVHLEAALAS